MGAVLAIAAERKSLGLEEKSGRWWIVMVNWWIGLDAWGRHGVFGVEVPACWTSAPLVALPVPAASRSELQSPNVIDLLATMLPPGQFGPSLLFSTFTFTSIYPDKATEQLEVQPYKSTNPTLALPYRTRTPPLEAAVYFSPQQRLTGSTLFSIHFSVHQHGESHQAFRCRPRSSRHT
jgi:hypothetical protein